jgi:hypothetical protein
VSRRPKHPLKVAARRVTVWLTESEWHALSKLTEGVGTRSDALRLGLAAACRERGIARGSTARLIRTAARQLPCATCGSVKTVAAGVTPDGVFWAACRAHASRKEA